MSKIETTKVSSWHEFRDCIESQKYREWLYRGHSDINWKLESSLFRQFEHNIRLRAYGRKSHLSLKREEYEAEMIKIFMQSAHLFLQSLPMKTNNFDWLSVMQHYGAPTRMLDFTFSPYVALLFACSNIKKKAAVYCIKISEIKKLNEDRQYKVTEKYNKMMLPEKDIKQTLLMPFEPQHTNIRLNAQQGAFLIPNTLDFSHDKILDNYNLKANFLEITFTEEIASSIIVELLKMNISFSLVFPGFDGFCKSFENIGLVPMGRLKTISE